MKRRQLFPQPWWLHDDLLFWAPLCDPANPLAVYRGTGALSMTRATAALRFDGTKFLSVGNGILRIEPTGALIEGQRINSMLQTDTSQDLLAQWTKTGITATFDDDANGYGAKRWTLVADASDRQFVRTITIPAAAYSLAFYVRKADGSAVTAADCNIYCDNADRASTYTLVGNGIYRVSWANFTGANAANGSGLTVKAGKTVHLVAPPQMEAGVFCSSPIPTTSAVVTRNDDVLAFPTSDNFSAIAGSIVAEVVFNAALTLGQANQSILGYSASMPLYTDAGHGASIFDSTGAAYAAGPGPSVSPVINRMASRWSGAGLGACRNGGGVGTSAYDGSFGFGDISIGGGFAGFDRNNPINIKNLRIWSRAFTDAEMQNLTR